MGWVSLFFVTNFLWSLKASKKLEIVDVSHRRAEMHALSVVERTQEIILTLNLSVKGGATHWVFQGINSSVLHSAEFWEMS